MTRYEELHQRILILQDENERLALKSHMYSFACLCLLVALAVAIATR